MRPDIFSILEIPKHLPIFEKTADITEAIRQHAVVIIGAETGSGKSTQLPKILLNAGFKCVGHTLPKRIAAQALFNRLKEESPAEWSDSFALQTRYIKCLPPDFRYKVMTDGILLAELASDPLLKKYQAILIDEAHERTLTIDLLLVFLKRIIKSRPNFRVIITSASLDIARFSDFFKKSAVILIPGRMFPVEIVHQLNDLGDKNHLHKNIDLPQSIERAIIQLDEIDKGDVLIFLSGQFEIHQTIEYLKQRFSEDALLPLYAQLPQSQQQLVFHPSSKRRLILATNVAETSLTIPRVSHVIDAGMARIFRYSTKTQQSTLQIEPISQAAAKQRAGRCGREKSGICIRLYSEDDFKNRALFTEPEIMRINLSTAVLKLVELNVSNILDFEFIDPPLTKRLNEAIGQLIRLEAIENRSNIDDPLKMTPLGREISRIPLDPPLAAILVTAKKSGLIQEVAVVIAALSIESLWIHSIEFAAQQKKAHHSFQDNRSDFYTYLQLWRKLTTWSIEGSKSAFKKKCQQFFLNERQIRLWQATYFDLLKGLKISDRDITGADEMSYDAFHRLFLVAFFQNVSKLQPIKKSYKASSGSEFLIHPSSSLFSSKPEFIFCLGRLETSQRWGLNCAKISLPLLEQTLKNKLRWEYSDPYWDEKLGSTYCRAKGFLMALMIVPERLCCYEKVNPQECHEMLIMQCCTFGKWPIAPEFFVSNEDFLRKRSIEFSKLRLPDLFTKERQYEWFLSKVPSSIYNLNAFMKWWRHLPLALKKTLFFDCDPTLRLSETQQEKLRHFPQFWHWHNCNFHIEYEFSQGLSSDGLTILIPQDHKEPALGAAISWNLPIYHQEMVLERLVSLPIQGRKRFALPLEQMAAEFLNQFKESTLPLEVALYYFLSKNYQWQDSLEKTCHNWEKVPEHLKVKFKWLNANNDEIGNGANWQDWPGLLALTQQVSKPQASNSPRTNFVPVHLNCEYDTALSNATIQQFWTTALSSKLDNRPPSIDFFYVHFLSNPVTFGLKHAKTNYEQFVLQRQSVIQMLMASLWPLTKKVFASKNTHLNTSLTQMMQCASFQEFKTLIIFGSFSQALKEYDFEKNIWNLEDFLTIQKKLSTIIQASLSKNQQSFLKVLESHRALKTALSKSHLPQEALSRIKLWYHKRFFPKDPSQSHLWFLTPEQMGRIGCSLEAGLERLQNYWRNIAREDAFEKDWRWFNEKMHVARSLIALDITACSRESKEMQLQSIERAFEEYYISTFAQKFKTTGSISLPRIEKMFSFHELGVVEKPLLKPISNKQRAVSASQLTDLKKKFS